MKTAGDIIESPKSSCFDQFDEQLQVLTKRADYDEAWPEDSLQLCRQFGVFRWFCDSKWGGLGWSEREIQEGFLRLANVSLTTAFVLTQWVGATQRIQRSENESIKAKLLPRLAQGELFATLGISHLTTSQQHTGQPAVTAEKTSSGFFLSGAIPWVTGANHADWFVGGAALDDGTQLLFAIHAIKPGVSVDSPIPLVAFSGSDTAIVRFDRAFLREAEVLAGPIENVLSAGVGSRTGGLQTSALALGLCKTAINYLQEESRNRSSLVDAAARLDAECKHLEQELLTITSGGAACSTETLRANSNSLVLRATQSALIAAKGAGFVATHPAGRWCRQALFFLVWSCPQPVVNATLHELTQA